MTVCLVLLMSLGAGAAVDLQQTYHKALEHGTATAVDLQCEWARAMGLRAESPSGVVAQGERVAIEDLDESLARDEWLDEEPMLHFVKVSAKGPRPIQVLVPDNGPAAKVEVHRRVSPGLYVRLQGTPGRVPGYTRFSVSHPGEFVVRERQDTASKPPKATLLDFTRCTSDSAARTDWGLWRVRPDQITGEIPLVLVHGLENDRWGEFIRWASTSPEARSFREYFQIWDFVHKSKGVNVAIGYSADYPEFDISVVAHLDRFIKSATTDGAVTGDQRYFFPAGPFAMLADSTAGCKALAFLNRFPEYSDRVFAVASIAGTHTGTPLATAEWLNHTFDRLGSRNPSLIVTLVNGIMSELVNDAFLKSSRQSDLDVGWANLDAQGGFGIPTAEFNFWRPFRGWHKVMLSPRDANQTSARLLPGFADCTFEPQEPLSTYCGGLDEVIPSVRGANHLDKFFLYCSYIDRPRDWFGMMASAEKAFSEPDVNGLFTGIFENMGLQGAQVMMAVMASAGSDVPLGVYALNDGIVPLQSQAFLDGKETDFVFETEERDGYRYPVIPYRHREDIVREHTLANPDRLRFFPGWSHLDTVTGRYIERIGRSELFSCIARDLLGAMP